MNLHKCLLPTLLIFCFLWLGCATRTNKNNHLENQSYEIMLFSTFHFANPGKDKVFNHVKDVMSEDSQIYLDELARRIAEFKPTLILLEFEPQSSDAVNLKYSEYREGKHNLGPNEIEQLGFRIAKHSGLDKVHGFDHRDIKWESERLLQQLAKEPILERNFNMSIQNMVNEENRAHASMSLQELLKRYNSPRMDHLNKGFYLLTNVAGAGTNFAGADASASWWHRNFRMLALIQTFLKPGERLIVIGGQGHIAVIRDLLSNDINMRAIDVNEYL